MTIRRLLALCLTIVASASARASAADPAPFEIDMIAPLTGSAAFSGLSHQRGMLALEAWVNAHGGINGRPIKFVFSDDGTNPQTVVQLTSELAAKHVAAILGPATSSECAAQIPLTEDTGPVTWCLSPAVKQPKAGSYAFMVGPPFADQLPFDLRYFRSRGLRRIAVITSTDTTGQDFDRNLDIAMTNPALRGLDVVAHEHFNVTDLSVNAQLTRIKAAAPDLLIAYTTGTPFATILRGVNDVGLAVPVFTSGGNLNKTLMAQYASIAPRELLFNGARGIIPDPAATGRMKAAQDVYFAALKQAGVESNYSLLGAWDPAMIVIDAFRRLGTGATAQQLRDYIEHLKGWTGVLGTYDFTVGNQRGIPVDATAILRWDAATREWQQVAPAARGR